MQRMPHYRECSLLAGATWRARALRAVARPGKFAVVGAANTLLDFALFLALVYLADLRPTLANVISYSSAIVNSFLLNKHWTFKETTCRNMARHRQFVIFVLINLVGLGFATAIVWMLADLFGPPLAKLLATVVTFGWNYAASRHLVFPG